MKRIFIPTKNGSDWQGLLAKPKLHWKKGASAMTAAAAWEDEGGALPKEIATVLNSSSDESLQGLRLLAAIPEWEVSLEGGETASHTDILALARNDRGLCAIAVEAKVNEDFGPLLKGKRAEASVGQGKRLDYLQSLLGVTHFDGTASSPRSLSSQSFHSDRIQRRGIPLGGDAVIASLSMGRCDPSLWSGRICMDVLSPLLHLARQFWGG